LTKLTFTPLGGGCEIGANSFAVECGGRCVVLDCGLHPKQEGLDALPLFKHLPSKPEAILVSHGHIDHCGAVPYLLKQVPDSAVYATKPTVAILDRMLHNSVSVMGTIAMEKSIGEYPLYEHADVEQTIQQIYGMPYDSEFALSWDSPYRARLHAAGHVLGSACIQLDADDHTMLYTGDVLMADQELLPGLQYDGLPDEVGTLVLECTRGAQAGADAIEYIAEIDRFAGEITRVLMDDGVVLVPAFALGRSQEILNIIARLMNTGRLPNVPVYSSGLGRAIYEIYARFPQYLRAEADLRPLHEFGRFGDVWERSVVRDLLREPAIIVATSGMMVENTPSAMIAQEMVRENRHGIYFTGYLDPDTLGYKLLHARSGDALVFQTGGKPVQIALDNRQTFTFSAHAPREDLIGLANRLQPRNIVLVHGDQDAIDWMRSQLNGTSRVCAPQRGETVELEA
jgi:Cft2 family RNA processing exonuclease